jgi:hypothetical protein
LSDLDNVATTIAPVRKGDLLATGEGGVSPAAAEDIPLYHKASLLPIARGTPVYKYGQVIGIAAADIPAGSHVHIHNLVSEVDYRPETL